MGQNSPSLQYPTSSATLIDSDGRDQYGLKVLSEGKAPVTIDIVAVHGLGGHLLRTWTHKSQCCWLRDLLPVDIPDARIMTFGYDAKVIGSSMNTFKDSAQLLLQHLLLKRDPELIPSSRPILFICHSLGGLVTKQALVKASSSPEYKAIRGSTLGTIFMGTPHRGSSVASLGKVVANIARLFPFSISTSHLNSLLPDSRDLSELSAGFLQNIQSPPVKVVNFFESKTTKIGLMRIPIVPQASAIMDPVGPIREGISLDGDHRQICQFSSGDDTQYQLVLRIIQSIMAPESDGSPPQVENPRGVGKSFLSSYIAKSLRAETDAIVVYNTFNSQTSGSRTEATLASVILGQLLAEPTLKDLVLSTLMELYRDRPDEMQISFREALQILSKTCQYSRRCYLVLDGLDEMAESTTTKTRLLCALLDFQLEGHAHGLKTIVVSRDVTPFREMLSFDLSLQIGTKHTESDVAAFARLHLSRMALPDSMIDLASITVQQRSRGLFIWASLFISSLQIESNEKGDLTSYLLEAEEGLSSLYAHAMLQLHRSSPELLEPRKLALTFCATADVPLDLTEIDDAIRFGLNYRMDTVEIVHKACGPFVEVTDGKVSLCHLSVRDYVLARDTRGNNIFLPDSEMAAHATMATICLGYLCLDDHQQPFSCVPWHDYQESGQYPLLRYACLNWERHMRQSGPLDPKFLKILRKFVTSNAGIRWAICYHPHFQRKMGESHISAIGELRSVLLRVKNSVIKNASTDARYSSPNAEICQALDTFLVQAFETVLAVERSLAGTKSRSTIERLLELSRVLQACGSPKQAQLTAREASSIATVRFGVMDPLSLFCTHHNLLLELNNMPMNMHSVSKKDILQGFRDLSFLMNEVLGRYHLETLRCYHDMGLALFRNQQVKESYHVLKQVYEDMRKHLGPSRLTQRTANNLANALYTLRRFNEAESILLSIEDVQQLSRVVVSVELDSYHIYSFEALALLANVFLQQIQPGKAVPLHERAIAGRALLIGHDAELFLWVKNLGLTLMYQKEFGKSSSLYVLWIFNGRKNIQSGKSVAMLRESLVECLEVWKSASQQGLCEAPVYDEKVTAALDQSLDKDPLVLSVEIFEIEAVLFK
ncbi:hypothetical protein PEX1_093050 [Penicillium expansum]|nr:hypothetical protein PEX1_093050 [Penicillium expansum]